MRFITLIKTAEESPSGITFISSVIVRKYQDIKGLLKILNDKDYIFAVHGKDHEIKVMETKYTSKNSIFEELSIKWHTFKFPPSANLFDLNCERLAEFIYVCGYDDRWYEKQPGIDTELRKE